MSRQYITNEFKYNIIFRLMTSKQRDLCLQEITTDHLPEDFNQGSESISFKDYITWQVFTDSKGSMINFDQLSAQDLIMALVNKLETYEDYNTTEIREFNIDKKE